MGRAQTTTTEKRTIHKNVNSASNLPSHPDLRPNVPSTQTNRELEIPKPSEAGKFLYIFGIPATVEIDEDAIIVTDYIVHMYGVGDTVQEAINDYKTSIKAYFAELQENEDRLGNNLKRHLYYLREMSKHFE